MPVCHLVACSLVYFVLSRNAPGSLLGSTGCYTLSNREHGLLHPWYFEPVQGSKIVGKGDRKQHSEKTAWRLADELMHQSIPPAPRPPPRGWPPGISIFFSLDGKFPGGGDSWAGKSPGVGTKKEGKCPVLRQQCNIFYWSHSPIVPF